MSPILVRPVREQLEHDRIIRLLQQKYRRRFDAGINPGNEQNAAVGTPGSALHPDLVLFSTERGRRLQAVVEVETSESVNHLEALAEWAHFARVRAGFHLYVPSNMVDVARRLCENNQIHVNEIWSYHTLGDEVRFALVQRSRENGPSAPREKAAPAAVRKVANPVKKTVRAVKTAQRRPGAAARARNGAKTTRRVARAQKRK